MPILNRVYALFVKPVSVHTVIAKGALARALIEGDARTADDVASAVVNGLALAAVEHGDVARVVFRRDGG